VSVAVQRSTVSLWPMNSPPVSSAPRPPRPAAPVPRTAETEKPVTEVLAAITSRYRDGRAGIISGVPSPAAEQLGEEPPADLAPSTHFPTVPLAFLSSSPPAAIPEVLPAADVPEVSSLWSRLVRAGRSTPRGRHSPKC
jgi:hypothetical protein